VDTGSVYRALKYRVDTTDTRDKAWRKLIGLRTDTVSYLTNSYTLQLAINRGDKNYTGSRDNRDHIRYVND